MSQCTGRLVASGCKGAVPKDDGAKAEIWPEVKGTIGLKQVVDKLAFSAIEHILKVAEDDLLLGRRKGRARLST
ncbi:MAG: hypothetical protein ACR2IV_19395 [Bryobacteraceae bacterium]